ncbi:MAG: winged helix-turn-helix domain-containing protein [Acidobacteria bacterium]|nr:winged helix-turn-helix domain-containing protein [Acidobacteriota bacterium]MCA1639639.1 winged helix-turn-helix domain-containing protein [Acidobacteriota bacterium]
MSLQTKHFYEFGGFRLDLAEKVLFRDGKPLPITPKVFETLEVLVEHAGHLIEKDELMQKIWQDRFVEESNLTFNIKMLRKALGDSASKPRFIETVPRRGYRFIAEVKEVLSEDFRKNETVEHFSSDGNGASNGNGVKLIVENLPDNDSFDEKPAYQISPSVHVISSIRSRPVLYSISAVIIGIFLLTGFFLFKNSTSFSQRFGDSTGNQRFLTVEKLTDTGNAKAATISPDGKLLAYYTTDGGKDTIWLRQLTTGKSAPIFSPKDERIHGLNFSQDGDYLYFSHQNKGEPSNLSRLSILGGTPTKILSDFHGSYTFSPDAYNIAFVRYDETGSVVMIAESDGRNERRAFASPKPRHIISVAWSPDGESIAYSFGNGRYDGGGMDYGIFEFNFKDETEKSLTDFKWNYLGTIEWLPDKSGMLVTAREKADGTDQIWWLSLPDGKAKPITNNADSLELKGASVDFSKIIAQQEFLNSSVWVAPTNDLSNVQAIAKAQWDMAWTADGKIIFPARETIKTGIWLTNPDGSDKKQITSNDSLERSPTVSPEGRFVVFVSTRSGRQNIWRMNADGGNQTQLTDGEGENNPTFTPDGQSVVFNSIKGGSLWKVSVEGGEAVQLCNGEKSLRVAISPDGKKFAYFGRKDNKRKLLIKSFPECNLLLEFEAAESRASPAKIVWAKDSRSLIYDHEDATRVGNLWRQSLDGGEPQKLTNFTSDQIYDFGFSPDGNWLAFVRGVRSHDAVLLKGFK